MNEKVSQWVLTDTERNIWVETLELGAAELGVAAPARISKRVLHGGLQEGVELVEVDNGALSFSILPTRGMGLWRGSYRGEFIGWRAPAAVRDRSRRLCPRAAAGTRCSPDPQQQPPDLPAHCQ